MPSEDSKKEGIWLSGLDEKVTRAIGIPQEQLEGGCRKLDAAVIVDVKQRLCGSSNDAYHKTGVEVEEGTDVDRRKRPTPNYQSREDIQEGIAGIRLRRAGRRLSGENSSKDVVWVFFFDAEMSGATGVL